MRTFILAVLFLVLQAAPPIPRQASDTPARHNNKAKEETAPDKKPVAQAPPSLNSAEKPETAEKSTDNPTQPNAEQSIRVRELPPVSVTRNWADWAIWTASAILALAGILGIWLAYRTLKVLERQTRAIRRQGLSMRRQTTILRKSAEATEIAAKAAKESVNAAISSDRAWLLVEDVQIPFDSLDTLEAATKANNQDARYFTVRFRNYGRTPAFIYAAELRYGAGGSLDTPMYPGIYSQDFTLKPNQHIVPPFVGSREEITDCWIGSCFLDGPAHWLSSQQFAEIRSGRTFLWAYGIVQYRDIHEAQHETRFCYRYALPPRVPSGREHFCIAGPTEYNQAI